MHNEPSGNEDTPQFQTHDTSNTFETLNIDYTPSIQASVHDTVGEHVPLNIKNKIWDNKFIDLSILLKSQRELTEEGEGDIKCRNGRLCIEKRSSPTHLTINEWTSAFLIYMSVYLEKHIHKAQELLKYVRDVRMAASRSSNWYKYDEQFRARIEKNPTLSWGNIHGEYWLLYITSPVTRFNQPAHSNWRPQPQSQSSSSFQNTSAQFTKQTPTSANTASTGMICRYYNNGTDCPFFPRCRFKHICESCGGRHRKSQCRVQGKHFAK